MKPTNILCRLFPAWMLAAALLSGCSTIRTLPGIGAAAVAGAAYLAGRKGRAA